MRFSDPSKVGDAARLPGARDELCRAAGWDVPVEHLEHAVEQGAVGPALHRCGHRPGPGNDLPVNEPATADGVAADRVLRRASNCSRSAAGLKPSSKSRNTTSCHCDILAFSGSP